MMTAAAVRGVASVLSGLVVCSMAAAQPFPSKPIRFILPFATGGGTDVVARIVSERMTRDFGQQVLVDNRPGAGGILGTQMAVRADPDGHTLVMGLPATITVSPALYKDLPFDPLTDLAPVGLAGTSAYVLSIHPSLPVKSVKDLVGLARARPGEIQYAAGPPGAGNHLAAELFKALTHTNMLHIPYKGGGPALIGLLSGEAQVIFGSILTTIPHIRSGRLRALAVTGRERSSSMPELPTIAEAGVADYEVDVWFGIFVPKNTPSQIISMLNAPIVSAMSDAAVKKHMVTQGFEPRSSTPEALSALIRAESVKWATIVRNSRATVN